MQFLPKHLSRAQESSPGSQVEKMCEPEVPISLPSPGLSRQSSGTSEVGQGRWESVGLLDLDLLAAEGPLPCGGPQAPAPQDVFSQGAVPVGQTSEPVLPGPRNDPDPQWFYWIQTGCPSLVGMPSDLPGNPAMARPSPSLPLSHPSSLAWVFGCFLKSQFEFLPLPRSLS